MHRLSVLRIQVLGILIALAALAATVLVGVEKNRARLIDHELVAETETTRLVPRSNR